jgi:hypothetical protein
MADRYDIDRERERERERERNTGGRWDRERDWRANEGREGEARYEDYNQDRERGDYGTRGDWGRQGSWGSYGNRPEYNRENEWRERRGADWGADRSDFGGARTGRTPLFGTGGGGFGTGFSSYGAAMGPYGAGALGGGWGAYGERERGRYAGRGPKGWQRSDDRIREDINERLTDHPHIDASEIEVKVQNGEVTMTGTVDERHAKRLAEDIAESVSGVREVHNQIRIRQGRMTEELQTTSTGTTGRNR